PSRLFRPRREGKPKELGHETYDATPHGAVALETLPRLSAPRRTVFDFVITAAGSRHLRDADRISPEEGLYGLAYPVALGVDGRARMLLEGERSAGERRRHGPLADRRERLRGCQ